MPSEAELRARLEEAEWWDGGGTPTTMKNRIDRQSRLTDLYCQIAAAQAAPVAPAVGERRHPLRRPTFASPEQWEEYLASLEAAPPSADLEEAVRAVDRMTCSCHSCGFVEPDKCGACVYSGEAHHHTIANGYIVSAQRCTAQGRAIIDALTQKGLLSVPTTLDEAVRKFEELAEHLYNDGHPPMEPWEVARFWHEKLLALCALVRRGGS